MKVEPLIIQECPCGMQSISLYEITHVDHPPPNRSHSVIYVPVGDLYVSYEAVQGELRDAHHTLDQMGVAKGDPCATLSVRLEQLNGDTGGTMNEERFPIISSEPLPQALDKARDRIAKLEAALREIAALEDKPEPPLPDIGIACRIARAALSDTEDK